LAGLSCRPTRVAARRPDEVLSIDADHVAESALLEASAKLDGVAVTRIGEDHVPSHTPLERIVELPEGDLPLAKERDFVGHTGESTTTPVIGPGLG